MSGIEVVGIVLGAIPLIVMAVQQYVAGASTIRRYRKYERGLQDIVRSLETEREIFRNTCEHLLNGLVHDYEISKLLDEPNGPGWEDADLKWRVENRLKRSFGAYMQTMTAMETAVNSLQDLVKLKTHGRQSQSAGTSAFEQMYHKFKFSLKKSDYDAHIANIRQHNMTLITLTRQNLELEPIRAGRTRTPPNIKAIQTRASNLYNALNTGFICACRNHHELSLRLDSHRKNCRPPVYGDDEPDIEPQFRLVFTSSQGPFLPADVCLIKPNRGVGHNLQQPRSTSAAATPSTGPPVTPSSIPTACPRIRDLCTEITKLQEPYQGSYIGILGDRFSFTQPTAFDPAPASVSHISLDKILSSPLAVVGRDFYRLDILQLAIALATNFLQLHNTLWIGDAWKINDIYFLEGSKGTLFDKPFVTKRCIPIGQPSPQTTSVVGVTASAVGIRNRPLFDLGVMLIELCLKTPFAVLKQRVQSSGSNTVPRSDFVIADQLVDEVRMESLRYGEAVRRCIRCEFDGQQTPDLEDESFLRAVYNGVVSVLEEDLRNGFSDMIS